MDKKNIMIVKGLIFGILVLSIGTATSQSSSVANFHQNSHSKIVKELYDEKSTFTWEFNRLKDRYYPFVKHPRVGSFDENLQFDEGLSVQQTINGGYIVVGYTEAFNKDTGELYYCYVLLLKFDTQGNQLWNKTFSGLGLAIGMSIQQTKDNGYIITGYTADKTNIKTQILLIKTDQNGNKEWERTFDEMNGCAGYSVQQTSDDGYIISGGGILENSGLMTVLLVKTDTGGDKMWNATFLQNDIAIGYSICETMDSGYIIAGTKVDWGSQEEEMTINAILIKTNSYGYLEWNTTFSKFNITEGYSVQQTSDTGYILTGGTASFVTNCSYAFLIKTDSSGNELWNTTYAGSGSSYGYCIQKTNDHGYIITGATLPSDKDTLNVLILKTDQNGTPEWNTSVEFPGFYSIGLSIDQTTDNGYIITGYRDNRSHYPHLEGTMDGILIKIDTIGNYEWITTFKWSKPDSMPPSVMFSKPKKAIYFNNHELFPFFTTIIMGKIDVMVNATDNLSGVKRVSIYVNNELIDTLTEEPYIWQWGHTMFFRNTLKAVALDNCGNSVSTEIKVWKFF